MARIQLQDIRYAPGGEAVLDKVRLAVEEGERLCVTGRNGAGKSSLLAIMAGDCEPDAGQVIRYSPFGRMPQNIPGDWTGTVAEVVESGMTAGDDAWNNTAESLGIIRQLGLDPEADFSSLSGGGKRRVALARALACSRDLILDEPTNHLDIATIQWLEDFLVRRSGTLIFVSHDRTFCRKVATRFLEVDRGALHVYSGTYDDYLRRREERLEVEERHHAAFDKVLAQEESWIRQGIKARRTRNMGRVRALEAMRRERAERRVRQGNVSLLAQEAERSGKLVIEARDIAFAYPGKEPVFSGFSTVIQRGDRIGLIGANGSGKTTLLRVLLGELSPLTGSIRHGTRLAVAYFDQFRESLDPEATVMDAVADGNDTVEVGGNRRHVAGYLQDFLFPADKLRQRVATLSGGERNRLLLARLFTRPSNVLVLDEPTNDLDVETLELLEEQLADYAGTVILVSHDRTFLDNLATSTLALEGDGIIHEYVGAYSDWLRQRNQAEPPKPNRQEVRRDAPAEPARPRKLTYKEQREIEELQQFLENAPARLEALESEEAEIRLALSDPDLFARDPESFNRSAARLEEIEEESLAFLDTWQAKEDRLRDLLG